MNVELKNVDLLDFKDFLLKQGYSIHVAPRYVWKVQEYLQRTTYIIRTTDHDGLRKSITEYVTNLSLSFQLSTIQAALRIFYYFISGHRFCRRLYATEFERDESIEIEIDRFRIYLKEVADLGKQTITSQCHTVKIFLYTSFPNYTFSSQKITATLVRNYLVHTLQHISAASKKSMLTRIRSYLRFLAFTDGFECEEVLKLPMTSPVRKRASLAKYLSEEDVTRLFATYDLAHPTGIRNYAIARCLSDLGLRCSEVAGISLDHIDWRQGTITIKKTKTNTERTLPLHAVTGKAIENYLLRSRPTTFQKLLFVWFKYEQGHPMGTSQVRRTIRNAAIRAGLTHFTGTHMLRHTAAKKMINQGVDLKTIADILGHESVETTAIYTKINFTELQDVAGRWPEVSV